MLPFDAEHSGVMADQHGRYEQLAVGHVLGGLDTDEAADFRSHLLDCRPCRTRVAELRGIATELEAAEREERARARVRTELPRRAEDDGEGEEQRRGIGLRHVTVATLVVLALVGALAFWNLHLRSNLALRAAVSEAHTDTLQELASGVVVPATYGDGISGLIVADDDQVALTLVGIADVGDGESLLAWLLDADDAATSNSVVLARPGPLDGGLVTATLDMGEAQQLVVTRERGTPGREPTGEELARAELRPADGES